MAHPQCVSTELDMAAKICSCTFFGLLEMIKLDIPAMARYPTKRHTTQEAMQQPAIPSRKGSRTCVKCPKKARSDFSNSEGPLNSKKIYSLTIIFWEL